MNPKGTDNIIQLGKKRKPDPEHKYRPEKLGRNRMKVTQLSTARLPRLLSSSPENTKKGDQDGEEKTESGRYAALEEAKGKEIEVASGCLLGSRLNAPSWERMRNKRGAGAGEAPSEGGRKNSQIRKKRQGADRAAPL
jgi:hypothetical protein